jgi:hypothetical protein
MAPDLVDQLVCRDRPVGVQQEICEQCSEASAVESDGAVVLHHLERPEDPELHVPFVALA